jgi:hypothetical protein
MFLEDDVNLLTLFQLLVTLTGKEVLRMGQV